MSTWLRTLVVGGITAAACVNVGSLGDDAWSDPQGRAHTESATSSPRSSARDASAAHAPPGMASALHDAGPRQSTSDSRGMTVEAEPDAEVDNQADAGFPELVAPILRDCTETLRCDFDLPSSVDGCVASSTRALSEATAEARQRFLDIVMRCGRLRGCDYVSCTQQP